MFSISTESLDWLLRQKEVGYRSQNYFLKLILPGDQAQSEEEKIQAGVPMMDLSLESPGDSREPVRDNMRTLQE